MKYNEVRWIKRRGIKKQEKQSEMIGEDQMGYFEIFELKFHDRRFGGGHFYAGHCIQCLLLSQMVTPVLSSSFYA